MYWIFDMSEMSRSATDGLFLYPKVPFAGLLLHGLPRGKPASHTGCQPLVVQVSERHAIYPIGLQWFFGDSILVSPVFRFIGLHKSHFFDATTPFEPVAERNALI
jgi:hypothetical protein